MRIQTVVQHHPSRAHLLPALLASLPSGSTIVADEGADDARRSPWRCYLQCLRSLRDDSSHLLVVQDDCLPCRDFPAALELVAARHPDAPLALFVPNVGIHGRRVLAACQEEKRYVELSTANTFVPCVAICWPRASVESILAYEESHPAPEKVIADDGVLGRWSEATRTRVLATVPSLVEHPDHERSLVGKLAMGGRNPSRIAACWMGEELSPLTLQWD